MKNAKNVAGLRRKIQSAKNARKEGNKEVRDAQNKHTEVKALK